VYVPIHDDLPADGLFDDIGDTIRCDDLDELAVVDRYAVPVGAVTDDPLGEDDFDDDEEEDFGFVDDDVDYFGDDDGDEDEDDGNMPDDDDPDAA
jgi:hypothetical protein